MDRLNLNAIERTLLGKKVKALRREGKLPAHVFGKNVETEHVTVEGKEFNIILHQAGETGLIDLKIGAEKIRPVLIRDVQYDPISDKPLHVDFYQVNLKEKVTVPVPLVLIGDEPEKVHSGEAIVLQTLNEVEVEALPTDLVENIEVDISSLKEIDDALTVKELKYDREKLTVLADEEEVVVKLAPAVSEEMEKLLEEEKAEAEAAAAEAVTEVGPEEVEEAAEGAVEGGEEGVKQAGGEAQVEGGEEGKKEG